MCCKTSTHVAPALLPSGCPYLNLGRFLGAEQSFQWAAPPSPRASHAKSLWEASSPIFQPSAHRQTGWYALAAARAVKTAKQSRPLESLLGSFGCDLLESAEDGEDATGASDHQPENPLSAGAELDWGEMNKASRKKATMYGFRWLH